MKTKILRDAAEDVVVGVLIQLAVSAEVKKTARSVIRTSSESLTVGEELDSVDIGLVSNERLHALAGSDIPHLRGGITSSRHEDLLLGSN